MGNRFSSDAAGGPFRIPTKQHVPKFLQPVKLSKKQQKQIEAERRELEEKAQQKKQRNKPQVMSPVTLVEEEHHDVISIDAMLTSSMQGEFEWMRGSPFQHMLTSQYPSPSTETEFHRLRILNFTLQWAFGGTVLAPIKSKLGRDGTDVLSVGCGPGIWLGHPVVDLAVDHPLTQFKAVDICNLIQIAPDHDIQSGDTWLTQQECPIEKTMHAHPEFTPCHPSLNPLHVSDHLSPWNTSDSSSLQPSLISPTSPISLASPTSPISPTSPTQLPSLSESNLSTELPTHSCPSTIPSGQSLGSSGQSILSNLDIHVLNITQHNLPFQNNSFDFVLQRMVTLAFTYADWNRVLKELVRVTKPGGYIQLVEVDYRSKRLGPHSEAWTDQMLLAFRNKLQIDGQIAPRLGRLLQSHGLEDVETRMVSIPLGPWGLDIGVLWQQNIERFTEAMMPITTQLLDIDPVEYQRRWALGFEDVKHVKAFTNVHVAWGRVPRSTTETDVDFETLFDD